MEHCILVTYNDVTGHVNRSPSGNGKMQCKNKLVTAGKPVFHVLLVIRQNNFIITIIKLQSTTTIRT